MNLKNLKKVFNKKIIIPIIFCFLYILFIPIVTNYFKALEKCFNKSYNLIYVIITCIIMTLILGFITFNIFFTIKRRKIEKEGIKIKEKDGTHGTASFINPHEIKELSIGKEQITPVLPDSFKERNRNILIWGASGSRKINRFYNTKCFKIK